MNLSETGNEQHTLIMNIGKNAIGFLADSVTGVSNDRATPVHLPPIAKSSWMKDAILINSGIIPIIDPAALILPESAGDNMPLESLYIPDKNFEYDFGNKDTEVMEFYLLNSIYSLLKSEVKDTISYQQISKVPETPGRASACTRPRVIFRRIFAGITRLENDPC
jgi:chemotaxis signal transduction protein